MRVNPFKPTTPVNRYSFHGRINELKKIENILFQGKHQNPTNFLILGERENKDKTKTQIFIEPDIKRIAFDQKDLHPSEVFTKVEATFRDGITSIIKKP